MFDYGKNFIHILNDQDFIVGEISGMCESHCGKVKFYNIKFYQSIEDKKYSSYLVSTGHLWFTPKNLKNFLTKYSLHTDHPFDAS
jgi:hypothetical protein